MKKELFALAQRNRNKMKYKTAKTPLQKDFITANTIIKDKTIKSNDDNNLNKGTTSPLVNTGKEVVIKNINVEDKYFNNNNNNIYNNHTKDNKSASSIILSGSNYNKMVPEVGVVVKQDNQSKNGGLNFQNQFGKMSVKEYEQLRAMYMNGGSSSNRYSKYSKDNYSRVNNSNETELVKNADGYLKKMNYWGATSNNASVTVVKRDPYVNVNNLNYYFNKDKIGNVINYNSGNSSHSLGTTKSFCPLMFGNGGSNSRGNTISTNKFSSLAEHNIIMNRKFGRNSSFNPNANSINDYKQFKPINFYGEPLNDNNMNRGRSNNNPFMMRSEKMFNKPLLEQMFPIGTHFNTNLYV
jgi:hypothetical protein